MSSLVLRYAHAFDAVFNAKILLKEPLPINSPLTAKVKRAAQEVFVRIAYIALQATYAVASLLEYLEPKKPIKPHLPDMDELLTASVTKIQALWRLNNEILLGVVAKKKIPQFGFHGTNATGMQGILESKRSSPHRGGYIWVASYDYQLDPITALADFYTIGEKAQSYASADDTGGTFTVLTRRDQRYYKYICCTQRHGLWGWGEKPQDQKLLNKVETKFFSLIWRNNVSDNVNLTEKAKEIYTGTRISTKELFPADEFHVTFDESTYHSVVKGLLPNRDRIYNCRLMSSLFYRPNSVDALRRYCLAERFRAQELLFNAFEHLQVLTPDKLQQKWQKYQKIGHNLMQNIDTVTTISQEELRNLRYA